MYCDAPIQEGGTRKNFSVNISNFLHSAFSCTVCRTCLQVGQRGVLITMLQRDLKISVLCALFLVYRLSGGNSNGCNYTLVFPTLNHSLVLTAEENANVVLPFQLDLEPACAVPDDLEIEVYKIASTDGHSIRGMICSFTRVNGVCHATKSSSCICGSRNGTFEFRRTVQLADNATWIWQIGWGKPRATQPKATKSSFTSRNPMKAPAAAGTTDDPATDDASSPQNDSNGVAIALVLGTVGIIAVAAAATVIIRMFLNRSKFFIPGTVDACLCVCW
ncbi:hypothetical protein BaRGS_00030730 [Batillaria attramentaria]|uniref:Uncharacterized protein n=1 Tax=Batillaria attramentaria TaxID=370345 RepID=A0ABD0JSR9_9CAEN